MVRRKYLSLVVLSTIVYNNSFSQWPCTVWYLSDIDRFTNIFADWGSIVCNTLFLKVHRPLPPTSFLLTCEILVCQKKHLDSVNCSFWTLREVNFLQYFQLSYKIGSWDWILQKNIRVFPSRAGNSNQPHQLLQGLHFLKPIESVWWLRPALRKWEHHCEKGGLW